MYASLVAVPVGESVVFGYDGKERFARVEEQGKDKKGLPFVRTWDYDAFQFRTFRPERVTNLRVA